jgi:hypothetical protein
MSAFPTPQQLLEVESIPSVGARSHAAPARCGASSA